MALLMNIHCLCFMHKSEYQFLVTNALCRAIRKCTFYTHTMLSTSLGKTFLDWRFILNENTSKRFRLTIAYYISFVFSVSVFLFSNIYPKVMVKHWSDPCNFFNNVF